MSVIYSEIKDVDIEEIRKEIEEKKELSFIFPYTSRETDLFCSKVLKNILEIINQDHLHSHLEYVVNELSTNASKANSKRIYFEMKGLDIYNPDQYEEAMKNFKEEVFLDFRPMEEEHIKRNIFVAIRFIISDHFFTIEVTSPTSFVEKELERIGERMDMAKKFENLGEVFTYGFDSTEGAGFGLIIVLLMLRKVNLDQKAISFENTDGGSVTRLNIPLNLLSVDQSLMIADTIASELDQMPQFPANIQTLQRELSNPDCNFSTIAEAVNSDPILSAEILRIANSPVYRTRNEITDVASAVRVMGMLGVKSILYNYGMTKIMRQRYKEEIVNEISQHSFMVALIGSFIARHMKIGKIAEDVYIASLLHDLGRIIVAGLNRELEKRISDLCRDKHIPMSLLDELTEGYNHTLIGAQVAEKWDFPEKLVKAIRYHHLPLEVEEEYRALVFTVYLANEIFHYESGERDFDDINHMVLSFFRLEDKKNFSLLIEELKNEGLLM
ncbi:HDOD domain-containing protein [Spirochaeta isovalerica]|uniref:Putative nucleotidyltransferase with HDIG domain n=1 Tax=Spirochaeta isovalerica TaxID=150 RepID=A0A841RDJ3_9SPIO|nr:HDOD domain-containing protein [Spirochaeta isovalerica]MBB6480698.1 putative nucleotidyltransferase with HDIG domain [Spirochaeta isovalerica]